MSPDSQQDFALAFLSILFEGVPFILLGTLISGFIDIYLPAGAMDRFLPRNKFQAVLMAGLLGAVFPVCECAVVPVIRRLVKKGLPVSCALTYMLAAPIVNPITALSTWKAFQGQGAAMMTSSRLLLGFPHRGRRGADRFKTTACLGAQAEARGKPGKGRRRRTLPADTDPPAAATIITTTNRRRMAAWSPPCAPR